jgi:hypothetical protein
MEHLWESPEFNDIKKLLAINSRQLLWLSLENILMIFHTLIPQRNSMYPQEIDPIVILQKIITEETVHVYRY